MDRFLRQTQPCRVVDIGSGSGEHARFLAARGYDVTTVDPLKGSHGARHVVGRYEEIGQFGTLDAVWCCHVLEHSRDPGVFLRRIGAETVVDGFVSITVPPMKPFIVGGHLTAWNAGLLLYNLVVAGFDCSDAAVLSRGYDVTVQVRHRPIFELPALVHDKGDLEQLAHYFPIAVEQGFDGNIPEINW